VTAADSTAVAAFAAGGSDLAADGYAAEQAKDVWTMAVFGHEGRLVFTGISQPWLREAMKRWAAEDLPVRRGRSVTTAVKANVRSLAKLSESLRTHRPDRGLVPSKLARRDIEAFLHGLAYQEQDGRISAYQRHHTCRMVRHVLRQMRALGLADAGGPLFGLADDFTVRERDLPTAPERQQPWRALPMEVLRQLCDGLPLLETLGSRFVRVAVELLIDTGRRPVEICQLPLNCLERDSDGKYVLIYDDFKNDRPGRRLPIADATASLILGQQEAIARRYPDGDPANLKLLPPVSRNPRGERAMTYRHLSFMHREWINALPPAAVLRRQRVRQEHHRPLLPPAHLRPTPRRRGCPHRRAARADGT
jgi:hypothetical protein